jgi:hypothetical protein
VRIAISGAHYAGKTTLAENLIEKYPSFELVEEPYHLMEEDGHHFSSPPTIEDYEDQLAYAMKLVDESDEDSIFDRSPLDFVAYALLHPDRDLFDLEEWIPRFSKTMQKIDVIIFVPLEEENPIDLPASEDEILRERVDEKLRDIWIDNPFDFEVLVLEVFGDQGQRVKQVQKFLETCRS